MIRMQYVKPSYRGGGTCPSTHGFDEFASDIGTIPATQLSESQFNNVCDHGGTSQTPSFNKLWIQSNKALGQMLCNMLVVVANEAKVTKILDIPITFINNNVKMTLYYETNQSYSYYPRTLTITRSDIVSSVPTTSSFSSYPFKLFRNSSGYRLYAGSSQKGGYPYWLYSVTFSI